MLQGGTKAEMDVLACVYRQPPLQWCPLLWAFFFVSTVLHGGFCSQCKYSRENNLPRWAQKQILMGA